MEGYTIVGKKIPQLDGSIKVNGEAKYTDDFIIPGTLRAKCLRSPLPHAKIINIDASKAERLIGVKGIVTGKDTLGIPYNYIEFPGFPYFQDQLPLCMEKVRYIGDEVAAVAAIDEDTVEEALDLIRVDYEELPAVFDPEEAMKPDSPKIHEIGNIGHTISIKFGDVMEAFQASYHVREDEFKTQAVCHCPLEPHAIVAVFLSQGRLKIWTSTQSPFWVRYSLAKTLGISEDRIRVIKPFVGGGFGGKIEMFPYQFCASMLSKRTGKPVKIVLTREEVFTTTRQRHPMIIKLKTGVAKDGAILVKECTVIADGGAYMTSSPIAIFMAGYFLSATYKFANFLYKGYHVYTNKAVRGMQRGPGATQVRYADDSQMDMIAQTLGIDPLELRLKNLRSVGDEAPTRFRVISSGFRECLEIGTEITRWKERRDEWKGTGEGLGLGTTCFVTGAKSVPSNLIACFVKIHEDSTASILSGTSDIGQGSDTLLCQIVAEELGVELSKVRILSADTEITPIDPGSYASIGTFTGGNAAREAAEDTRNQIFGIAAERLEARAEDLTVKDGWIYVKGSPDKGISFSEVIRICFQEKGSFPMGKGCFKHELEYPNLATGIGELSRTYSYGAQIAHVKLDNETGSLNAIALTIAHDCGFAINPMAVEGQLEGSAVTGMGYALWEEILYDRGQALNPNFRDYKIPTAVDAPQVKAIPVQSIDPEGPFGAKESGEGTQISTAPAIANALYHASSIRIESLPLIPEKILKAMEKD